MVDEIRIQDPNRESVSIFADFLMDISGDEELKARILEDPGRFCSEKGIFVPEGLELRVHENTPDTFHLVFPPDPNEMLQDEALMAVAGGKTASCAGTAGTLASASTLTLSWGTASTAACVGTMGCAS